jgi:hypothetical protein
MVLAPLITLVKTDLSWDIGAPFVPLSCCVFLVNRLVDRLREVELRLIFPLRGGWGALAGLRRDHKFAALVPLLLLLHFFDPFLDHRCVNPSRFSREIIHRSLLPHLKDHLILLHQGQFIMERNLERR